MTPLIFGLGPVEIAFCIGAIILMFGGKKIPELMRGVGQGIGEFRKARRDIERELNKGLQDGKEK